MPAELTMISSKPFWYAKKCKCNQVMRFETDVRFVTGNWNFLRVWKDHQHLTLHDCFHLSGALAMINAISYKQYAVIFVKCETCKSRHGVSSFTLPKED